MSADTPLPFGLWQPDAAPSAGGLEFAIAALDALPTDWRLVDGVDLSLASFGFHDDATATRRRLHVRERTPAPGCEDRVFVGTYDVLTRHGDHDAVWTEPTLAALGVRQHAGQISAQDSRIVGWAVEITDYFPGERVDAIWQDASSALGPAGLDPYDVLSLGEGGEATFGFERVIRDGPGPDLAVFENAVPDNFIEFGVVAVSTDGEHYATFDRVSLVPAPVGTYDVMDARVVDGLAGSAPLGLGVGFDLAQLREHPEVVAGLVDLGAIHFVRVTDLVGDGREFDSFGRPVWDPFPTYGSAGFDVDGIAILHGE